MKYAAALLTLAIAAAATTPQPGFEQLSKRADAARQANRSSEAIDLYRKALKLRPEWKEGLWFLATLEYEADQFPGCRDTLRRLVGIDETAGPAFGLLGLCEYETREYDRALSHLKKWVVLGMAGPEQMQEVLRFHEALLLTRAGEYEVALSRYVWFARVTKDTPQIIEAIGLAALRKPMLPNEYPPGERELVLAAGRAMYEALARHPKSAEQAFQDLVTRYSDTPNVHYLYASYLLSSNADLAVEEFKRELESSPAHVPAMIALAVEYLKRNDVASGLVFAKKAAETAPDSFAAQNALGRLLLESGDVKGAIEKLELATKLEPNSPQNHIALSQAYAKAGRTDDAKREREKFLALRKEIDALSKPQ